jgi:putative DNA primase/helicase
VVDKQGPTLLIDEADSFLRENEALRGILNSGHTRASAYVLRCVETDGVINPVKFCTWGAKAIAGIKLEQLHATLTSRSILLPLRRKKPEEKTESLRHADQSKFDVLKSKLYRWCVDNGEKFSKLRPELPELQNRDGDNWEPLLAIAELAGPEWLARIKHAAIKICCKADESPSLEVELLTDIKAIFSKKNIDRISSVNLIDELCNDELAPWSTYNRGFPFKPRQLAKRLSAYGIHPKAIKINGQVFKGYLLSEFADVFERYVFSSATPQKSVTRLLFSDSGPDSGFCAVTDKCRLPLESEPEAAPVKEGNLVTDKAPLPDKEKDQGVII